MTRDRRVLPHNLDAEASILGGILLRNEVLARLDTLEVDDFYSMAHKVVFGAMRALEAKSRPIDVVTLEVEIERESKLDAVGGVAFLGELALRVPTPDNVEAYAEIVRDKAIARRLMLASSEITEKGYEDGLDVKEYLLDASAKLASVERSTPSSSLTIGDIAKQRVRELFALAEARARGEVALTGVPTGIAPLDRRIGGWQFGIVNMLAARPAMGKTSTALAGAFAATAAGHGVHHFSLEDSWRSLADRCLARESRVAAERLRQADLDFSADVQALGQALSTLALRRQWLVDDRSALSAEEIVRAVRKHRKSLGTKLVIVDYVQLVRRPRRIENDENAALDHTITTFAHAAKADDLSWLVLSQLNRSLESRTDRRPQMSDLRGSGALEERVKVLVGQYRGSEYYDEPKKHIDYDCDCPDSVRVCSHAPTPERFQATAQLLVLKQNNGRTGRVFASWHGPTMEIW